jgi:hypothetical protein
VAPITDTLRDILADGEWHTLGTLVARVGYQVPPEKAARRCQTRGWTLEARIEQGRYMAVVRALYVIAADRDIQSDLRGGSRCLPRELRFRAARPRPCVVCHEAFVPRVRDTHTCSPSCTGRLARRGRVARPPVAYWQSSTREGAPRTAGRSTDGDSRPAPPNVDARR